MVLVSVTRARVRSLLSAPSFAIAAYASLRQARQATGFVGGSVCPDRRLTFWTMTVWESEEAMHAYRLSGPHHAAMPKFAAWCDEASVVHWRQPGRSTPSWSEAADRMRSHGRPSNVRRPSPDHQDMTYSGVSAHVGGGYRASELIAPHKH